MTSLLDFIPRVRALKASPETEDLLEDLLGHLLNMEGPPVEPLDFSEGFQTALVRTAKGRPLCIAQTWLTGPWRCLVVETMSIPMGRPITLKDDTEGGGRGRTVLDSRSSSFQKRIVASIHALGIAAPVGEGAVHTVLGSNRTFIAWRAREADEDMNRSLRGDADNFAKNILDGMQKSGVLPNDRGVHRVTAAKDLPQAWAEPPLPVLEVIEREARVRKDQGQPFETIMADLRLSKAHMGRIFPDYRAPKSIRPKESPGAALAKAKAAVELILQGTPYKKAREEAGATGTALRKALGHALKPRVMEGKTTLHELANELELDPRSVSGIFKGDSEAHRALRNASKELGKVLTKAEASAALNKALAAVQSGKLTSKEASHEYGVNLVSLRSKIGRTQAPKKVAPKKTKLREPKKPHAKK